MKTEINMLMKNNLFEGFTIDELKVILGAGKVLEYSINHVLFKEKDTSNELYIILEGEVEIKFEVSPNDKSVMDFDIILMRENDVFGHFSFIDGEPRSATAQIHSEKAKILKFKPNELNKMLETNQSIGYKFYKNISVNLCDLMRKENSYLKLLLDYNI